jgi:rhodanese-related sulfurtransferase
MKNFLKKLTGLDKVEARIAEEAAALEAKELELLKVRDPKAYATKRNEPWVNVIDVKVNAENVRNGFFELDWNDYFIAQLVQAGYGVDNDPEEEIVDRWFRDIVHNMLEEGGQDTNRGAGYINVIPISKGKSEVS